MKLSEPNWKLAEKLDILHSKMNRVYPGRTDEIKSKMRGWKTLCLWYKRKKFDKEEALLREKFIAFWAQAVAWEAACTATVGRGESIQFGKANEEREKMRDMLAELVSCIRDTRREVWKCERDAKNTPPGYEKVSALFRKAATEDAQLQREFEAATKAYRKREAKP